MKKTSKQRAQAFKKGTLYKAITDGGPLFLRFHVGDAADGDKKYNLSTMNANNPCVESVTTGRTFILSWQEIIEMAVEKGIDDPAAPAEGAKRRKGK